MAKSKRIAIYQYSNRISETSENKSLSDFQFESSSWKDATGQKYNDLTQKECEKYYRSIEKAWDEIVSKEQPNPNEVFYESQKVNIESLRAKVNV